jgi:carboxylate-amine ligase
MAHRFTVGVEEEFQIVDPETWELRSHVSELLASGASTLGEQIKREMHQSIVEVGTKICGDVNELRDEIFRIRRELAGAADRVGLAVAAAGTHPFSDWKDQVLSPDKRYENIVEELQQLARSLLIFGLHVHVAVPDRTTMIDLMNMARYFLPHLLALSTSSPFWMGRDTGLKSYRTTVFRRFPRTGVPDHFESWSAYENYVQLLVELRCIDDAKKIWWDVRPHPTFGTLEFRVCDVTPEPEATVMIARPVPGRSSSSCTSSIPAIRVPLYPARADRGEQVARCEVGASTARLIDFGKRAEVPMRALAVELLEFIDDVLDELGQPRRRSTTFTTGASRKGTSARPPARGLPADRRFKARWSSISFRNTPVSRCGSPERDDEDWLVVRAVNTAFRRPFIERGEPARASARHHGGDGEVRRHEDGRARRVPGHRRSHLARGRVLPRAPEARGAAGQLRHQQPVLVDGRRQVFQLLGHAQARCGHPAHGAAAAEGVSGRRRPDVGIAAQSRLSDRLGRPARLRRPAGHPEAVFGRRLEARLQGEQPRGAARGRTSARRPTR